MKNTQNEHHQKKVMMIVPLQIKFHERIQFRFLNSSEAIMNAKFNSNCLFEMSKNIPRAILFSSSRWILFSNFLQWFVCIIWAKELKSFECKELYNSSEFEGAHTQTKKNEKSPTKKSKWTKDSQLAEYLMQSICYSVFHVSQTENFGAFILLFFIFFRMRGRKKIILWKFCFSS